MLRSAFVIALAVALAGCVTTGSEADREPPPPPMPVGEPTPPPPPPPPPPEPEDAAEVPLPAPAPQGGASGGAGSRLARIGAPRERESALLVVNRAGSPIREIYVSPCTAAEWGPDLLDSAMPIDPGSTLSFALQGGCWDLRAVRADETETVRRTAQIQSSTWRWEVR